MKYEGVSFNEGVLAGMGSAEAVIESRSYQGLWPKITREEEKQRLRQVYELAMQKKGLYEDIRPIT
jgi:hypothetical protein